MTYSPTLGYKPAPIKPDIRTRIWRLWCQGYDAKTSTLILLSSVSVGMMLGTATVLSVLING